VEWALHMRKYIEDSDTTFSAYKDFVERGGGDFWFYIERE